MKLHNITTFSIAALLLFNACNSETKTETPEAPKPTVKLAATDTLKVKDSISAENKPIQMSTKEQEYVQPVFTPPEKVKEAPDQEISNYGWSDRNIPATSMEMERIEDDKPVFDSLDQQPVFNGGISAFMEYVRNSFNYPVRCQEAGISGSVKLRFVVERNGRISHVKAIETTDACPEFTTEAIKVVEHSPRWKPGIFKGKAVRAYMSIPIVLRIE